MKRGLLYSTILCAVTSFAMAGPQQSAFEAKKRMEGVASIFANQGLNAFAVLNGVARSGSGGEMSSKGSGTENLENAAILRSADPKAELFCVRDDKWAVKQLRPLDVNKNAMETWTDAEGKKIVPAMISALRASPNGVATVEYTTAVEGVKDPKTGQNIQEKRIALIYSSKALLGKPKNMTGSKFFCGTTFSPS